MALFADERGAVLSPCGMFRYYLWREWDVSKPTMLLLMLNPSRADHRRDDHTITKSIAIARNLGFGRLDVGNLAAFRSSDPGELRHASDPVGPENDRHLREMLSRAHTTVCAWGANATLLPGRVEIVAALMRAAGVTPYALKLTNGGFPSHPLARGKGFIPVSVSLIPFSIRV